jgi:hypothetical protein
MVYELRVYHCLPGRLPALVKRFETATIRLFEKHGIRQAGFWTVAIGESNHDLIYILQWESLNDRDKRFAFWPTLNGSRHAARARKTVR